MHTSTHLSIHPSIHPSIYLSTHASIHPSIYTYIHEYTSHTSIHPPIDPSVHLFIHPSVHLFVHTYMNMSIHPSIHPSIRSSIHLSIHTYVYSSIHPPIHPSLPPSIHLPTHQLIHGVNVSAVSRHVLGPTMGVKWLSCEPSLEVLVFSWGWAAHLHRGLGRSVQPWCKRPPQGRLSHMQGRWWPLWGTQAVAVPGLQASWGHGTQEGGWFRGGYGFTPRELGCYVKNTSGHVAETYIKTTNQCGFS